LNNNLTITQDSWFGDYFEDIMISIKAIPKLGYEFSHWSGDVNKNSNEIFINPNTEKQVTANFVKSDLLPLVINEINYKSSKDFDSGDWIEIYNPNEKELDIANWSIKDDDNQNIYKFSSNSIIGSKGFLVVVNNIEKFDALHNDVNNVIGDFDFGLGKSDSVRLFNIYNQLVDNVDYSNKDPWVECADGNGYSLELINASLNNLLSENWSCNNLYGSPGKKNNYSDIDNDGIADIIDNCPETANSDQADLDEDGIGDVCDDDRDGDGVANTEDNCPDVSNSDQTDLDGDGVGDVCDDDIDGDGILNTDDNCPDTPEDVTVDVNGCEVFDLPLNNNKVSVISASCIGNTDGSIGVSVEDESYNYTVTVTGQDDPISLGAETKTASVTGLGTGTYTVCFKVDGQDAYEQCFEVNIAEPKALSAFIDVDNDNRTTSIQLSGSSSYNVEVNDQRYDVKGDRFTTNLPSGLSIIKISTDLDCQGIIEREIFISEDIHYYPNPTETDVNVHVSGEDTMVQVSVFSEKGDLIYTREQQIQDFSRKTNIDLSRQITGTYIVVMDGPTVRKTFKIVKQ
jgi:hypothetical protein